MIEAFQSFRTQYPVVISVIGFLFILVITWVVVHFLTKLIRKLFVKDGKPLPFGTIFVNTVRIALWCIGLGIGLDTCFGIDMTGLIAGLGVAGIAISLGFQDTLSNFIGGLQVTLGGIMKPGDHISVLGQSGYVKDITWRTTKIEDTDGYTHLIPNSLINSNSLTSLDPTTFVEVPFLVSNTTDLVALEAKLIERTETAVGVYMPKDGKVSIRYVGGQLGGIAGSICVDLRHGGSKGTSFYPARSAIVKATSDLIATGDATAISGTVSPTAR